MGFLFVALKMRKTRACLHSEGFASAEQENAVLMMGSERDSPQSAQVTPRTVLWGRRPYLQMIGTAA